MNKEPEFLEAKLRHVHDPHVQPLTELIERWRQEGRRVPYADPDSGGIHSRILFLAESPGPQASAEHGSRVISPDNNDPSAERFWRLSRKAGLPRDGYINWNAVPWYVSDTRKKANASNADGQAAQPYLHEFVMLLAELRVVVLMGRFSQHWWPRYLTSYPSSQVLPALPAPHPSPLARISCPGFEDDILAAMTDAKRVAWSH
jgi:uracil-DNA glycosylase